MQNTADDISFKNMGTVAKYSKWLTRAGWVGIGIDLGNTGVKAYDAHSKGDTKGRNVEVGKGVGSIVGGVLLVRLPVL